MNPQCHLCGHDALALFAEYSKFRRVTSDCKPWPAGGELAICNKCFSVQVVVGEAWREEIGQIYKDYNIYYQADGSEQSVFEQEKGHGMARSSRLIAKLKDNISLPQQGRLLDFGCGNGGFLRSFNQAFPAWKLAGVEYDGKYREIVESIPNVEQMFTAEIEQLPGEFDIISLIHVLEHIESPRGFLERLRRKLNQGGLLLIELPHYMENPFELLIADHATHFDALTIRRLIESAGLEIVSLETKWVPREISIVARAASGALPTGEAVDSGNSVASRLEWLDRIIKHAGAIATQSGRFGLFGTSIAATWLFGEIERHISFFVDEDINRAGRTHCNRPIYHPGNVPAGSDVYVLMAPEISAQIASRLSPAKAFYHIVPALP